MDTQNPPTSPASQAPVEPAAPATPVLDQAQLAQQIQALLDNPETASRLVAHNPELQAILDERRAGQRRATVNLFLDGVLANGSAASPRTNEVVTFDLSRFDEDQRKMIVDSCREATPETVEDTLKHTVAAFDQLTARARLSGMGYQAPEGGGRGQSASSPYAMVDTPQGYREHVDKLCQAMDDHGRQTSQSYNSVSDDFRQALRRANQPFIDQLLGGLTRDPHAARALADSARTFLDDAASLSTMLQQPTVTPATAALITQIYWRLSWLPFVGGITQSGFENTGGADAAIGGNLRIPVETRPSGQRNLFVGEGQGIPTVHTTLRWLNFAPKWLRTAFELTKDAQVELSRGAARYDALARQMYTIAQIIAENIDLLLAHEHINASDEFESVAVTGEAHVSGDLITNAGTLQQMGYGPSVVVAVRIASTFTAGGVTYRRPVVQPRRTRVIQVDGSQSNTLDQVLNPISVTVNAVELVRGELDGNGDISDGETPDVTAVYAVDYENGVFCFSADAGVDASNLPTFAYSYATNFDVFDLGGSGSATDLGIFYDGLLRRIDLTAATMGGVPRFRPPTQAVFTLQNAVYAESARMLANLFTPRGDQTLQLSGPNPSQFGSRGNVSYSKVNTPMRYGQSRILLMPERAVKYGIQNPFQIEGPMPNYDGTVVGGKVKFKPVDSQFYIARQHSVICTPVAFDMSGNTVLYRNHPFRSIKLVGTASM